MANSSSLFDDTATPIAKPSPSLFAEDLGGGNSHTAAISSSSPAHSPWSMPTPKKASSRGKLLKTLLPTTNETPDGYAKLYQIMLDASSHKGSGASNDDGNSTAVSFDQVKRLLKSSELSATDQARIIKIMVPPGEPDSDHKGLSKPEINVLLALIGLAQEGEDISLDGVDERRQRMLLPPLRLFLWRLSSATVEESFKLLLILY